MLNGREKEAFLTLYLFIFIFFYFIIFFLCFFYGKQQVLKVIPLFIECFLFSTKNDLKKCSIKETENTKISSSLNQFTNTMPNQTFKIWLFENKKKLRKIYCQ